MYMTEELGVDEACSLRVEAVDAGREGRPQALSLKLGLTTCDSSIVDNFPSHVIEPCQPSHDCMGQTMTINVRSANLVDDEIRMQRKAGGVLQVFVNDVQEFSLTDPHDSIFPLSKGDAYPFLMLSGSVSKIRSIESGGISVIPNDSSVGGDCVVSKNRQRVDSCCVICMDKMISHMAVPCNHAAFCDFDANEHLKNSKVCPVCRKGVTNFVRIFIP